MAGPSCRVVDRQENRFIELRSARVLSCAMNSRFRSLLAFGHPPNLIGGPGRYHPEPRPTRYRTSSAKRRGCPRTVRAQRGSCPRQRASAGGFRRWGQALERASEGLRPA
jgi:hypothetical protein